MATPALYQNVFDNPILTRELRRRMRGKALVYSIIGYIALMTVTSILILIAGVPPSATGSAESTQAVVADMANTGQRLFQAVSVIQGLLVLIIAPTITAGMTTAEKEKKTFDFLRVTTISPWMYITGSFLSTVFYVGLALLCALPLISLAFLYGGIGRGDVAAMGMRLLGSSMALSAFGLYISSIRERTRTAQGIVVFFIFALCFGGALAYGQVQRLLGSTASLPSLAIAGFPVPFLVIEFLAFLAISGVFLLVATRKLFEPEETRAFSHTQFGVILVLLLGLMLSVAAGAQVTGNMAMAFLGIGALLLAVAAVCFGVGRMEVGDEVWHLKRLAPVLRPVDPTYPFLIAVGMGWWLVTQSFLRVPAGFVEVPMAMITSTAWIALAGFAFFCGVGRLSTAVAVGRRGAGRATLLAIAGLWFVLPFLASVAASPMDPGTPRDILEMLGRFSPFSVMAEGLSTAAEGLYSSKTADLRALPVFLPATLLFATALVLVAVAEIKSWQRWRSFDYHYDMPAA